MSAAAAVLTALLAARSPAPDVDVVEQINAAYEARDYARAIDLLDDAYARDPNPSYLYSKGEILVAADDCANAVAAFEAFLATAPPEVDAAAARDRIDRCNAAEPEPPPPRVVAPAPAPAPPPDVEPRRRPVAGDPTFIALMTVGAGIAITGASLLVAARFTADVNRAAPTEDAWEAGVARARGLSIGGAVVVGVGGALIVGAVARAIVVVRKHRHRAPQSSRSGGRTTSVQ